MIVSASRRTDIPALYGPWLQARLAAGFAAVPHPFRPDQVRRVDLVPAPRGSLEALILWTRNPAPLLADLPTWEERGLRTLWLVTVTGYPVALEPGAPPAPDAVEAVRRLAAVVGADRVAWRYDPVLLCPSLGLGREWHRANFRRLAARLAGAVGRCIVSYYDDYAKSRRRLRNAGLEVELPEGPPALAEDLVTESRAHGIPLQTCCESWEATGTAAGACIDGALLKRLWGLDLGPRRDPGQRSGCRCAPSVDLGVYHTCTHGCLYCYATGSPERARANRARHDPAADRLASPEAGCRS